MDIIIISHPDVSETVLAGKHLRDIFLGDKTTWANGDKIKFAVLRKGASHSFFLKKYVDKAPNIYIRYWKRQILTGQKASLPTLFKTEQQIIDFVSKTKGGIGYISGSHPVDNLKIIEIIE